LFDLVEDETRDGTLIIETKPRVSAPLVSSPWPPRPVPTSRARARDRMTTALIAAIFVSMLTALVAASILQLH
jgi:hypothetical protein